MIFCLSKTWLPCVQQTVCAIMTAKDLPGVDMYIEASRSPESMTVRWYPESLLLTPTELV